MSEEDADIALAAELALGLLTGEARVDAERRRAREPDLAARVAEWEGLLAELAEEASPPDRIKTALDAALDGPAPQVPTRLGQARSALGTLGTWQVIAASLAALAVAELAVIGFLLRAGREDVPPPAIVVAEPTDPLVATLLPEDAPTPVIVVFDAPGGTLALDPSAVAEAGRDVELWLLREGLAPTSLGVLRADGPNRVVLSRPDLVGGDALPGLALSLEPPGGSPSGAPTGPIVASGTLRRLPG